MKIIPTKLPSVLLLEPKVYKDSRGCFMELYNEQRYKEVGIFERFVQDNLSVSKKNVLRGLHYQLKYPQGKLVHVIRGKVLDVVVDIRHGSPHFGLWASFELSDENHHQVYVPPGFAHGFSCLSEDVIFHYKCTDYYHPEDECGVLWSDGDIGIDWGVSAPELSGKDVQYSSLKDIATDKLPVYEV